MVGFNTRVLIWLDLVAEWLLNIVGSKIHPDQFGGLKGNSLTHYLIQLVNFILANLDNTSSTAVLAIVTDFKKAFNRMSHLKVISIIHKMGAPGWLLKIISSYLSKRTMVVQYKGATSKENSMPGGAPQGTVLGVLIFIFQMNELNTVPAIPKSEFLTPPGHKQHVTSCKFMDDNITAVSIDLKSTLEIDNGIEQPAVFHSRTGHSLPNVKNPLIPQVQNIINFTNEHEMKINTKKTNIMLFTRAKTRDFQPQIFIEDQLLDVIESTKLLGVMISSNMKWDNTVEYIRSKAAKKLWMLRRVRSSHMMIPFLNLAI